MTLSVVIPVYNERATLPDILRLVMLALPGVAKQIIVVDDCSTDGTREWLIENLPQTETPIGRIVTGGDGGLRFLGPPGGDEAGGDKAGGDKAGGDKAGGGAVEMVAAETSVTVRLHDKNRGKGRALRTGFETVNRDVVVIQDADLEYDPADWAEMLDLIERDKADVVFGSRFYGRPHRVLYFHHYMANKLISFVFNFLFDQMLSDIEVCYKMFRRTVLESIELTCDDFGFEIEFSAKVAKSKRWRIYETGCAYYGRTYEEGKKINWRDGVKALWYVFRFRVF
ncbi:MAG: glycosyltransferase family 2 protein [Proteobacteria bacterium]|nr:glycosyltransferase family 2 protein [Pseudomonadota bacterium]